MASQDLVIVEKLSFSRGNRVIFDEIDLVVPEGKLVAIMGPSGTGKTTLLQLIGGQLKPNKGRIWVKGQALEKLSRKALYQLRRDMGLLFQGGALFTDLSVYENVAFPLKAHTRLDKSLIHRVVLMKLEAVGLRGARHLYPANLSGGMARRVALARALALDPQLMMYDEPFTGQDPISMGVLISLIKNMHHALGMTSLIVSHDVPETASIADYIYLLANGRVVCADTPERLLDSADPYAKQFMGGLSDGVVPFHYSAPAYRDEILSKEESLS